MAGYSKLWSTIVTSSVWSEDDKTRIMWITMLAVAEADGFVSGAIPGMATVARLTLEDAKTAIDKLSSPDPYSRTPDAEGRRIIPVPGGWQIVNYEYFRKPQDDDERRRYMREYMRQYRTKNEVIVNNVNSRKPQLTQAEAEAEAEAKKSMAKTPTKNHPKDIREMISYVRDFLDWSLSESEAKRIQEFYSPPGGDGVWRLTNGRVVQDWHRCMVTCKNRRKTEQGGDPKPRYR
jgi:hypothetical protein